MAARGHPCASRHSHIRVQRMCTAAPMASVVTGSPIANFTLARRSCCGGSGCRSAASGIEVHHWRTRDRGFVRHREVWPHVVPEHLRCQIAGEGTDSHVILLYGVNISLACNGDAIL